MHRLMSCWNEFTKSASSTTKMSDSIAQILRIDRRYQRSVHLERDFTDPLALTGYVPTQQVEKTLDRILGGLDEHPNRRAFRLTGNYGAGKSSFALLLAHILQNGKHELPGKLQQRLRTTSIRGRPGLMPVLITGSREPLTWAILKGLAHTLESRVDKRAQIQTLGRIYSTLRSKTQKIDDDVALDLIQSANEELMMKDRSMGMVIILDELGKFLEYAVQHPENQDVYFLQQLAEMSCRSNITPVMLVGLLHQGFSAYAHTLSQMDQREWDKVAARFDEIVFKQPPEQIVNLVGAALNVRPTDLPQRWMTQSREAMSFFAKAGWFGVGAAAHTLCQDAPSIYPLHPSVLPVLVRFFSKFGQNERSLFSFLLSNEPGGLLEFALANQPLPGTCYRLHNFYDYVAANYGDKLGVLSLQNHWNHIDAVVRSCDVRSPEKTSVVKTVGILNLVQLNEAVPTVEALTAALAELPSERDQVRDTIQALTKDEGLLHFRGKAGGFCIWAHTSVNLFDKYDEANRSLPAIRNIANVVRGRLDSRPLVARRHYIETGNLRSFEMVYCSAAELSSKANEPIVDSDGRILIPLCENSGEATECREFAKKLEHNQIIIGITQPLSGLDGYVKEVERWEWILNNTPELKDDWFAAQEVDQKLKSAQAELERRVQHYVGLRHTAGEMPLDWYYKGATKTLKSSQAFLAWLSEICDGLFFAAPNIHNELINRRSLSSAAARARMKLVERLFNSPNEKLLGMDPVKRPPEMSMYFSVLEKTTLHRQTQHRDEAQSWIVDFPTAKDPARLLPALEKIKKMLESSPDSRVKVSEIISTLRRPPYGVRDGLIPLLLVIVLVKHQRDIAYYEDGTFLSTIGQEEILRLTKAPGDVSLQWCRIGGLRQSVFERLLSVLESGSTGRKDPELLDVVRPLVQLVAGLPPFARNTKSLSPTTMAVRDVLTKAEDPTKMVFSDLPIACGVAVFSPNEEIRDKKRIERFVTTLKQSTDELRSAYPNLLERMVAQLRQAFEFDSRAHGLKELREALAKRAAVLTSLVADVELKGFCMRLSDVVLEEAAWLESFGSYVAATPPSRWRNQDEFVYNERIHMLAAKFIRTEAALFPTLAKKGQGKGILVTITHQDGNEKSQVVQLTDDETRAVETLKAELAPRLLNNKGVSLTALSQLVWDLLGKQGK